MEALIAATCHGTEREAWLCCASGGQGTGCSLVEEAVIGVGPGQCLRSPPMLSKLFLQPHVVVQSGKRGCLALQEDRGGAAAWWKRLPQAWGPGQRLLACGAQIIAELRLAVREELGYSCSAGQDTSHA